MQYIKEAPPIKVSGSVVASYGSEWASRGGVERGEVLWLAGCWGRQGLRCCSALTCRGWPRVCCAVAVPTCLWGAHDGWV